MSGFLFLNPMKLWSELITASSSSSSQARNCWFWNLNSLRLGAHPLHLADSKANVLITFQLCDFILWIFGMFSLIVYCSLHKNMVLKSVIITFIIECNMQTFITKFTICSWRNSQNLFSIPQSAVTETASSLKIDARFLYCECSLITSLKFRCCASMVKCEK